MTTNTRTAFIISCFLALKRVFSFMLSKHASAKTRKCTNCFFVLQSYIYLRWILSFSLVTTPCSCSGNHLVRVGKISWFGLKYLFWSLQSWQEIDRHPVKNSRICCHRKQLEMSPGLDKKMLLLLQLSTLDVSVVCRKVNCLHNSLSFMIVCSGHVYILFKDYIMTFSVLPYLMQTLLKPGTLRWSQKKTFLGVSPLHRRHSRNKSRIPLGPYMWNTYQNILPLRISSQFLSDAVESSQECQVWSEDSCVV